MNRYLATAVVALIFGSGCSGAESSDVGEDIGTVEQAFSGGNPQVHNVVPTADGFSMCPYNKALAGVYLNNPNKIACIGTSQGNNLKFPATAWHEQKPRTNGVAKCPSASQVVVGWNQSTGAIRCAITTYPMQDTVPTPATPTNMWASELNHISHQVRYIQFDTNNDGINDDEIPACKEYRALTELSKRPVIFPYGTLETFISTCGL